MARWSGAQQSSLGPRVRAVSLAVGVPAVIALFAQGAIAQTRKGGPAPKTHAAARSPAPKRPAAADAGAAAPGATSTVAAPVPAAAPAGAPQSDAGGVVEARTLDGGTHVFKFSELDIEGRLKSPQLVYFLRRVRAEFAAGDLGHRSFMREMSETRQEPGL